MSYSELADGLRRKLALPIAVLLGSAALFTLLLAYAGLDERWENDPAHFWLVLVAAVFSVAVGYGVNVAARKRRDARLVLVSLAFVTAASFLGLHALATPGVVLDKNAGFDVATPFGLAIAGAFAAASSLELGPLGSARVMRFSTAVLGAVATLVAAWAGLSFAEVGPLARPLGGEELDGWQISLAGVGVLVYTLAGVGYFRLYRRRRDRFQLAVAFAFALLAEAMVVIAWARNWHASWWEWHVLMLAAFAAIALAARREWHEERWSALYLEQTLGGARDVSVLFADLQGFTSFSERTSPRDVADMLNAYFRRILPLMQDAGGEVHQLIGDAIMVVFNKEGNQPDHASQAARAGLLLQSVVESVAEGHEDWPRFRVGINSGEAHTGVVGGARGHRKHDVIGDTVNLAARLEGRAPVGRVVVGAETAGRLPDGAVLERLPELLVKGKEAPIEAYVLHSL